MAHAMANSHNLWILAGLALIVVACAIATGQQKAGPTRRTLARLGATGFFALLVAFFWLSPEFMLFLKQLFGRDAVLGERSGFLTGMAVFFSIGGGISAWKLVAGLGGGTQSTGDNASH